LPPRPAAIAVPTLGGGDPLTLGDVLADLAQRHPWMDAARAKRDAASARQFGSRGAWDPKLKVKGTWAPIGYYDTYRVDAEIEQATPLYGLSVFGGYRLGLGDFATYDKGETNDAGEARIGANLPLWQGGGVDEARADIQRARAELEAAELEALAKQIELEAKAASAYWKWVAAGERLGIAVDLRAIAVDRDDGLREAIGAGVLPRIEATDNARVILKRDAKVVAGLRKLQAAALELALLLRDPSGDPVVVGPERLPGALPAPVAFDGSALERDIADALRQRPDLLALDAERRALRVDVALARNERSPRVDLQAFGAKDFGDGANAAVLDPFEFNTSVVVELPIPLRKARGKLREAQAKVAAQDATVRFAADTVAVEVRDAYSAVLAAIEQVRVATQQAEFAQQIADAEREKLTLGTSTVLVVNLREQAVADARDEVVDATLTYHLAWIDYRAALGLLLSGAASG
jgi:outer membrane protein TolC